MNLFNKKPKIVEAPTQDLSLHLCLKVRIVAKSDIDSPTGNWYHIEGLFPDGEWHKVGHFGCYSSIEDTKPGFIDMVNYINNPKERNKITYYYAEDIEKVPSAASFLVNRTFKENGSNE